MVVGAVVVVVAGDDVVEVVESQCQKVELAVMVESSLKMATLDLILLALRCLLEFVVIVVAMIAAVAAG